MRASSRYHIRPADSCVNRRATDPGASPILTNPPVSYLIPLCISRPLSRRLLSGRYPSGVSLSIRLGNGSDNCNDALSVDIPACSANDRGLSSPMPLRNWSGEIERFLPVLTQRHKVPQALLLKCLDHTVQPSCLLVGEHGYDRMQKICIPLTAESV